MAAEPMKLAASHEYSGRTSIGRVLIACVVIAGLSAKSEARHLFDFFYNPEEALATLELSNLPAARNDIVGLTFTARGQEMFGLGPTYPGEFNSGSGYIIESSSTLSFPGEYVLAGENFDESIWWRDTDSQNTIGFNVGIFGPPISGLSSLTVHDSSGAPIYALGAWRPVPEPTGVLLLLPAVILGLGLQRRSRC